MSVSTLIDVCRSVPFSFVRAVDEVGNDGLTLEGYAAVFDQQTEVDSWEGSFIETIRKGAFRKTIRERTPVLQFDHGRHPLVGSIPIGRIAQLREDEQGLYVQARLSDNWLIEPVRNAIRDESIDGMSFRFEVVRDEWRDNTGKLLKAGELMELMWDSGDRGPLERTLVELRVRELGPVVFPQYEGTSVSVRAREVADTIFERDTLKRGIRRSLAADASNVVAFDEDVDDELREEIARAVLFTDAPSTESDDADTDEDESEKGVPEQRNTDAPPIIGHPSQKDAPPDNGHPSSPDNEHGSRQQYLRRAYVTREGVGKRFKP